MARIPISVGKLLYGLLFVVLIPALLVAWAMHTSDEVTLAMPFDHRIGILLLALGLTLIAGGMLDLWRKGEGLPMNAYPPKHYVTTGFFKLMPHPIYTGFVMVVAGASVYGQSSSGLWYVTPVVALSSIALVLGYERLAMRRHFGVELRPIIGGTASTSSHDVVRLSGFVVVSSAIEIVARSAILGVMRLSVLDIAGLLLALSAIIVSRDRRMLSRTVIVLALLYSFMSITLWTASSLSFAFGIAMLASRLNRTSARLIVLLSLLSVAVIWIDLRVMHAVVLLVICLISIEHQRVWEILRRSAEFIANSWHEWRIGPLRIVNHGIYTGVGAALGFVLMDHLTGGGYRTALLVVSFNCLLGAALWAQLVEGSEKLLRPYGYYGGALGILISAPLTYFIGADPWVLLAAFSVALPWVQAIGRLRCLVQGCCHGSLTTEGIGIRYRHPLSRVDRISGLGGMPLHPTQLYSIGTNAFTGVILYRMWLVGSDMALISGSYLILNGIARFVEEAYRGETQTRTYSGLRFYQWMALASVALGIWFSGLHAGTYEAGAGGDVAGLLTGVEVGLFTWFAQGMDFPSSTRRFSRLT